MDIVSTDAIDYARKHPRSQPPRLLGDEDSVSRYLASETFENIDEEEEEEDVSR